MPSTVTWADLRGITLREIILTEKEKHCMISLICEIYKIQQTSQYNKKDADSQTQRKNQWLPIRRGRGGETYRLGEKEEQILGYKIGYEDVLNNTRDIANTLYICSP